MAKTPRPASTYRGARRNLWRKTKQHWELFRIAGDKGWRQFAQSMNEGYPLAQAVADALSRRIKALGHV